MIQEEKQLLLKDLCGRLLYGVKVKFYSMEYPYGSEPVILTVSLLKDRWENIQDVKPYLRSMSSMTEEEAKEVCRLENFENRIICVIPNNHTYHFTVGDAVINWLNEHHFDYRGLIPMGLALEAPEGMYENF